ncbi:MAG: hypothetical protein ACREJ3_09275, partial [Polyangiaceae bacterium]
MKIHPLRLATRLIAIQVIAWCTEELLVAVFAPRLLLLDRGVVKGSAHLVLWGWLATVVLVVFATTAVVRRVRPLLAELASGAPNAAPEDVYALYAMPLRLVAIDLAATLLLSAATLVAPLRPEANDLYTQVEIVLLMLTMTSVAALPAYVMMRASVAHVLELVPVGTSREAIDRLGSRERRMGRVRQRLLAAAWVPVAFVALGASLLVHAHLRAFDSSSRQTDAAELVQGVLCDVEATGPGQKTALAEAQARGYDVKLSREDALFSA